MAKRSFHLTKAQVNELLKAQQETRQSQTSFRYQAVRLYGSNFVVSDIQAIVGCSRTSLLEWVAS